MFKQLSIATAQIGISFLFACANVSAADELKLPAEMPQEGSRDTNLIQVEPTVINEKYYTSGAAERHQKTSPTLPYGAEIPDSDEVPSLKGLKSDAKSADRKAKREEKPTPSTEVKPKSN